MKHVICLMIAGALALSVSFPSVSAPAHGPILGFTTKGAAHERALEAKFDAALNRHQIRAWLKSMSSEPNNVGSPHDKANAERMLKMFRSWGFQAHLATYKVLFPTPKSRELELVAPTHYKAKLREPPVKGDPTSYIYKNALPPYNAYSGDGDVTAPLVYVNYGTKGDYQVLARHGISVKGKIVIVRYGHSWRGIKVRYAQRHGAVGCIIYSDPANDGYRRGNVFPKGGWRDRWGVQRGSVMRTDGDPLTPGYASVPGAKRIPRQDAKGIKKIPVLPISYGDALPLLKALGGPTAPGSWQGALPMTYHLGPGPAKVHLKVYSHWNQVKIYDVIAKIRGSEYPDQWVMRGNHHDAWVFGADDPLSSNVAMLEGAKAIGSLLKTGWRPKRTIVYMSWDAEEPGLLGSTEWVEQHASELQHKGVVYINSDNSGRGFLHVAGSSSLQAAIYGVARSVQDPETGVSLLRRARARRVVEQLQHPPAHGTERASVNPGKPYSMPALGSGSDYTPFLDHIGVMSLSIGFGGESEGTQYHSRYDDFYWYSHFGDAGFADEVALAKVGGHAMLRFADADILPYSFTAMARHVARYVKQIKREHGNMRKHTQKKDSAIRNGAFKLAADPTRTHVPPKAKRAVPELDFAAIDQAVARLQKAAAAYDRALHSRSGDLSQAQARQLNVILLSTGQQLLYAKGLPRRQWFRNLLYAPSFYRGYSVRTLPGIREAIEARHWKTAQKFIGISARALDHFSDRVRKATQVLDGA